MLPPMSPTPERERTVADALAEALHAAGIRVAFGVPGGEVLTALDALARRGIEIVLARHEAAAAHFAQGVARATGAPGLLFTTVGPGVAMAVDGIASAHQDRVPLIALTACLDDEEVRAGFTHQLFDQAALLRPVTKGGARLSAADVDATARWATSLALAPRPGPVHLELPPRVAESKASRAVMAGADPSAQPMTGEALEAIDAMARALGRAQRPLVLVGLDALEPGTSPALRALCERLGAPVLTTYLAKGVIDERSPRSLGAFGLSPSIDRVLLPLVKEADVVLAIGYDPIEVRAPWTSPFGPDARVLELAHVARDPRPFTATHAAIGSLPPLLRALTEALPEHARALPTKTQAALAEVHARMDASAPGQLVSALREALDPSIHVAVDTGAHRILLSQRWVARMPGEVVQSTGLCTMACGVPLATGLMVGGRRAIAVTGDGGLEMMLGDLATVRDLGLPLPIVVFDDQALELIALKQRSMGHPSRAVNSGGTDFAAVGRALGGRGVRIERPEELGPALREALASPPFTILHCPIPRGSYDGIL